MSDNGNLLGREEGHKIQRQEQDMLNLESGTRDVGFIHARH